MNRSLFTSALAGSLLLCLLSGSAVRLPAQTQTQTRNDQPPPTAPFQGEIEVREVGIVVQPPAGGRLSELKPADFLVFQDGAPRQVLKVEPLGAGAGGPWSFVLYVDRVLTAPDTVVDATLALARQARELTRLGTVEVVVADPEPRVTLAASRSANDVSDALGAIADQARRDRSRANDVRQTAAPAPEPALLRRQLDRMLVAVAGRPGAGAQALFLVADGFVPPPGEADLLSPQAAAALEPAPPGTAAAALRESARVLAAGGWVTFVVPLRQDEGAKERQQAADVERIRISAGGSPHTTGVPPVIPMGGARGPLRHEKVADVLTRTDSAPWMTLVQPTSGTILGVEEQLAPALSDLGQRWRVWYQAPETRDGQLHRVEVRLPSATTPLRGPLWVRSASPEGIDAARARLLAGGAPVSGTDLQLTATVDAGGLRLRVPPSMIATKAPAGPVRVSIAFDNRSEVRHTVLPDVSFAKAWEHTLALQPPSGAKRAGVVVEDLSRGAWGGAVVNLGAAGGKTGR